MSTAVNTTVKAVCKECPFIVYSTYLMPFSPCNKFSCSCTPCVLYWLPQGTILSNSCNSGDKRNCQNNKCFFCSGACTCIYIYMCVSKIIKRSMFYHFQTLAALRSTLTGISSVWFITRGSRVTQQKINCTIHSTVIYGIVYCSICYKFPNAK